MPPPSLDESTLQHRRAQPCISPREAFYAVATNRVFTANNVVALLELLVDDSLSAHGDRGRLEDCLTTLFTTQPWALMEAFERECRKNNLWMWSSSEQRWVIFTITNFDATTAALTSFRQGTHFFPKFLLIVFFGAHNLWCEGRKDTTAHCYNTFLDGLIRMRPLKDDAKRMNAVKQLCGEHVANALANLGHAHPHRKAFLLDACLAYVRGTSDMPREDQHRLIRRCFIDPGALQLIPRGMAVPGASLVLDGRVKKRFRGRSATIVEERQDGRLTVQLTDSRKTRHVDLANAVVEPQLNLLGVGLETILQVLDSLGDFSLWNDVVFVEEGRISSRLRSMRWKKSSFYVGLTQTVANVCKEWHEACARLQMQYFQNGPPGVDAPTLMLNRDPKGTTSSGWFVRRISRSLPCARMDIIKKCGILFRLLPLSDQYDRLFCKWHVRSKLKNVEPLQRFFGFRMRSALRDRNPLREDPRAIPDFDELLFRPESGSGAQDDRGGREIHKLGRIHGVIQTWERDTLGATTVLRDVYRFLAIRERFDLPFHYWEALWYLVKEAIYLRQHSAKWLTYRRARVNLAELHGDFRLTASILYPEDSESSSESSSEPSDSSEYE